MHFTDDKVGNSAALKDCFEIGPQKQSGVFFSDPNVTGFNNWAQMKSVGPHTKGRF